MARILITLGPTRERIDDVRYITNASSGRMGLALAREALRRGHDVTIVSGPISEPCPEDARVIRVESAREMLEATLEVLEGTPHDLFVATAAVGDYAPVDAGKGKIPSGEGSLTLLLAPTKKITAEVKKRFPALPVVAFKAESGVSAAELRERALKKVRSEGLDLVVANDVKLHPMGEEDSAITLYDLKGATLAAASGKKEELARTFWDALEESYRLA